jgi:hypothetical protein
MKYRTGDPKKKKKAKVRGVDVDKLPEGRIKEFKAPFPFRKRKKK